MEWDEYERAALREWAMMMEATASVRLDRDSDIHTCHAECDRPQCVERRKCDSGTLETTGP